MHAHTLRQTQCARMHAHTLRQIQCACMHAHTLRQTQCARMHEYAFIDAGTSQPLSGFSYGSNREEENTIDNCEHLYELNRNKSRK